ncbi:GrpB family protein [Candidatus Campbellbacteria bacterium]|nr:MAG: GrpB family protein [Candidatus Campbellbacteria bacterium]
MIKESQEYYLSTLPNGKMIEVKPFDPQVQKVANKIIEELHSVLPTLPLHFGGAAALGIAGQNDIDIIILCTPSEINMYRNVVENLFGAPSRITKSVKWQFQRDGFDVELYMTDKDSDSTKDQIKIFELLSKNKKLCTEYEQTKLPYGMIDFKEYMRKKYTFFNKVLEEYKN